MMCGTVRTTERGTEEGFVARTLPNSVRTRRLTRPTEETLLRSRRTLSCGEEAHSQVAHDLRDNLAETWARAKVRARARSAARELFSEDESEGKGEGECNDIDEAAVHLDCLNAAANGDKHDKDEGRARRQGYRLCSAASGRQW